MYRDPTIDELLMDEHWRELAACRDADPDLFFASGEQEDEQQRLAKAICTGCPVAAECLAYALETRQVAGIWGGHTAEERKRLRRRWSSGDFAA